MIWTISNLIKSFGELDLGCLVIYQTKNTSLLYVNIQPKKTSKNGNEVGLEQGLLSSPQIRNNHKPTHI